MKELVEGEVARQKYMMKRIGGGHSGRKREGKKAMTVLALVEVGSSRTRTCCVETV